MNKQLKAYYKAVEDLTKLFCEKYFGDLYIYDSDDWVGGEIGGVIAINDYFFNLSNIEEAIKYKATKKEVFGYYDYSLGEYSKKKKKGDLPAMNFRNYLKYYRGFSWKNTKES